MSHAQLNPAAHRRPNRHFDQEMPQQWNVGQLDPLAYITDPKSQPDWPLRSNLGLGVRADASLREGRRALSTLQSEFDLVVEKRQEIIDYIRFHGDSVVDFFGMLKDICARIASQVNSESSMRLSVYCDPEIDHKYLLLTVRSDCPEHTLAQLKAISNQFNAERSKFGSYLLLDAEWV